MQTVQIQLRISLQKKKAKKPKQNPNKKPHMLQLKITYYLCINKLLLFKCMRVNTLQKQENSLKHL